MNAEKLATAMAEALRFIAKAEVVDKISRNDGYIAGGKESGAARRASMDLTRALADLRRSA
jgi:hypothetical protein